MTSRGGDRYDRAFMEGFIRPGLDPGNCALRSGLSALGVVPTRVSEISIYKQARYAQPSNRLERYIPDRGRTDANRIFSITN